MPSTDPVLTAVPVVVIDARPLGDHDAQGHALFAIDLTVLVADGTPWRSRISVAVPAHGIRRLHPGAELAADLVATGGGVVPVIRFDDLDMTSISNTSPTTNVPSNARSQS